MPDPSNYGIISLIPLTITLLLAFWKKDAIFALFVGCISGIMILGMNPSYGFSQLAQAALGNEDFIWILLIQIFIGILIAFFMKAGVIKAFAEVIALRVSSKRGVKFATWLIGLFTVDDYMSPLIRGVIMRPITDKARISREKLAFILDSTCSPVCTIIPFMAWGAYVAGLIADQGGPVTSTDAGVNVYISSVPFNFYAITMLLITLLISLEILPDIGPMKIAEKRAAETGKVIRDGAVPLVGQELEELQIDNAVQANIIVDFIFPVLILIGVAIGTYIVMGSVKILECFITAVIYLGIVLMAKRVFIDVKDLVDTAIKGMKSVMAATIILALAYCINTITKSMGAADYIISISEGWLTPSLFLAMIFIIGAIISFFTGTSWGTFAIL
ncbi:MAG: hypothetical protein MI749_11510, partial [Desulfovibrionales bacterium]|nr:hypothetical protein [Desulfovibrionales bacterium]